MKLGSSFLYVCSVFCLGALHGQNDDGYNSEEWRHISKNGHIVSDVPLAEVERSQPHMEATAVHLKEQHEDQPEKPSMPLCLSEQGMSDNSEAKSQPGGVVENSSSYTAQCATNQCATCVTNVEEESTTADKPSHSADTPSNTVVQAMYYGAVLTATSLIAFYFLKKKAPHLLRWGNFS